jgi:cytochrome c-type biogenesis protein CcsB
MTFLFQITFFVYLFATVVYLGYFVTQEKKIRTLSRGVLIGAGLMHTGYFVYRYIESGHTPLTNNHEAVSFFAWSVTWAFLSFRWRYPVKNFGAFVTPLISLLMLVASLSSKQVVELPPALQSNWLPAHASIAILANGFMALAFCGGIMYLLQEREIKNKRFGLFYTRLPSLEALDNLNQHCLAVGFPLLTLGIITGSIWAKQAWGAYWQWDPKETWSLITWFIYAAILHQRMTVGWRRRRAAIMAIVGFSAVLFTLWGVTYLLGGVHSYAG